MVALSCDCDLVRRPHLGSFDIEGGCLGRFSPGAWQAHLCLKDSLPQIVPVCAHAATATAMQFQRSLAVRRADFKSKSIVRYQLATWPTRLLFVRVIRDT